MSSLAEIKITFLGGAGTVTGSKHLLEVGNKKILIDCGLFQGLKELRLRNWSPLAFDASDLDCVLLTHGHLDHTGYLPLLVKQGFKGPIYATQPTVEICKLILLDSAKIQEEDSERANRYNYSKHHPAKPLYTTKDAERVFPFLKARPTHNWFEILPNISFRFKPNGHIIGSVFIELKVQDKMIVFSGDIGRHEDPLMPLPEKPEQADVLVTESTYGGRIHPVDPKKNLSEAISKAASKNGTIIIPSFAVERTQLLMYYLWQLKKEKLIPELPIYMDSPMGSDVLKVFGNNPEWHKLSAEDCHSMTAHIKLIKKEQETEALAASKNSKIIIAGSGMAAGGRVLTYFEHYLNDPKATILLAGYQAEGTRGRALLSGVKEIKMRGKLWPVQATTTLVEGLSAHADQNELLDWMSQLKNVPQHIFIVHGEKANATALKNAIAAKYNYEAEIAELNQSIVLK